MTDNPIFTVAAKAEALRAQGADVITLATGEPQAATSAAVVETAVAAVRDPATHHYGTAHGDPALRALVATAIAGDTQLPGARPTFRSPSERSTPSSSPPRP